MDEAEVQQSKSPAPAPRGRFSGKLDDRGRLKLPTNFQAYLAGLPDKGFFVTSIDRKTVQIYPDSAWEANLKNWEAHPEFQEEIDRVVFNATDLGADAEMDNQGRITFNTDLRKALDLDGQALHFFVEGRHITVLTEARYQEKLADAASNTDPSVKTVKKLGML